MQSTHTTTIVPQQLKDLMEEKVKEFANLKLVFIGRLPFGRYIVLTKRLFGYYLPSAH